MSLSGSNNTGGSINIRRDVQDVFYRYKMPRIQSKIEGKGNGIKTVVPNTVDIAKALNRPPAYITKFFGAELGALSTCDEKAAKYIVNGAHDAEKLQNVLDGFISKFVLCQKCDNPETILSVSKKDGTIFRTCQACGYKGAVDMTHKLASFIRANPPPKSVKKSQAKDRAGAADEMVAGIGEGKTTKEEIEGIVAPDGFDDSLNDVNVKVADDDWAEETAAAARENELSGLTESVRSQLIIKYEAKNAKLDALDAFGDWLDTNINATNEEITEEMTKREIHADKGVVAIVQVLFVGDFVKVLKARLPLLKQMIVSEKEQKALLGSVERLVGVVSIGLLNKTAMILQALYNSEIVDEEVLVAWRENPSKKYVSKEIGRKVRKEAQAFFDWLENAESDDDDDKEDDTE